MSRSIALSAVVVGLASAADHVPFGNSLGAPSSFDPIGDSLESRGSENSSALRSEDNSIQLQEEAVLCKHAEDGASEYSMQDYVAKHSSDVGHSFSASTSSNENSVAIVNDEEGRNAPEFYDSKSTLADLIDTDYVPEGEDVQTQRDEFHAAEGHVFNRKCEFVSNSPERGIKLECKEDVQKGTDVFPVKKRILFQSAHCIKSKAQRFGINVTWWKSYYIGGCKPEDMNKMFEPEKRGELFVKATKELDERFEETLESAKETFKWIVDCTAQ